ncbi:MAG: succinate dehydrogenase/fumarate reductase iron-sulfur subunit [Chloroflexi bacterium ADurb.Bin325]|nr:MAG: succinate dehydrogenase/fumarate reductase iron-sulfur subunit [Chloroflexi bacterium ADurb.Bin325]
MENIPWRISYYNIAVLLRVFMFVTIGLSVLVMAWGLARRYRLWRSGQPQVVSDRPLARLGRVFVYAVVQLRVLRQRYPAAMHLMIFWAMALLFIGTTLAAIDTDIFELLFRAKLLKGDFYLAYKVALDLAGLFGLIGLGLAVYRRYVQSSPRLNVDWRFNTTLPLLAFILLSGLVVEALRLAIQQPAWAPFSVVGYPISLLFRGGAEPGLRATHQAAWTIHFAAVAAFFVLIPWTNMAHIFTSPFNIFVAPFRARGALNPIPDLEQAERLGASRLTDFSWPQLASLDACTECGRCQAVCPAYEARQPLNPKYLILDLQHHMTAEGPRLLGRTDGAGGRAMVGDVIKPETLWACTTCYHCVYECPVLIDHVDAVVEMRRYLALMEGELPASLATTLTNIERAGNPWKQPRRKRTAWTQALDFEVPVMANVGEAEVLWWVGCAGSYDPRNQKVTRALAQILHAAGVNYAILGEEETCNGDPARRAGNEYLFQQLAQANIETLKQYKFKVILTQCPHCYNTLLNEYPQFGGDFQVMHHTQYIEALLAEQNISVRPDHDRGQQVTFHDPCYLGRYNDEYEAPRVLAAASGMQLVEMARSRDRAMCCGGGGARVWIEEEGDVRINRNRLAQIRATGAGQAAAACPFCLTMLEDARGALGADDLVIRDVAEIVADALVAPGQARPQDR